MRPPTSPVQQLPAPQPTTHAAQSRGPTSPRYLFAQWTGVHSVDTHDDDGSAGAVDDFAAADAFGCSQSCSQSQAAFDEDWKCAVCHDLFYEVRIAARA